MYFLFQQIPGKAGFVSLSMFILRTVDLLGTLLGCLHVNFKTDVMTLPTWLLATLLAKS